MIIDPASALTLGKVGDVYGWYFDGECKDQNFTGENPSAESGTVSQWESFDNITPDQFENLTDDHYVLASPVMAAFGLKDKTWGQSAFMSSTPPLLTFSRKGLTVTRCVRS